MNIDTSNRRVWTHLAARWLPAMLIGMLLVSPTTRADDIPSGLADPTRPSYVGSGSAGMADSYYTGPVLQSTFISASQRRAVISGKSFTVGDKFGGAVITDIQPYEVVLERGGRQTRLRLLPKLAKEAIIVKVPAISREGGNEK